MGPSKAHCTPQRGTNFRAALTRAGLALLALALLGPALSACAPREYREAVEQLDSPHPDSPRIEPLAGLLAPPAATDTDTTRPAAAPEPSPLDPDSGLIARNEALNDRAQELAARPGPDSPPPAQADLRDRADALRARQD